MINHLKKWLLKVVLSQIKHHTYSTFYWSDSRIPLDFFTLNYPEFSLSKSTKLCRLMTKFGSDKGRGWHNYTKVYSQLLQHKKITHLFELGIGSTKSTLANNMGVTGTPGASLKSWKAYFPDARIYGADIDSDILFQEERLNTFMCDQTQPESIKELWTNGNIPKYFQFIVDDGYHNFEANKTFFEHSIQKLDQDGIYIIEDISNLNLGKWDELIKKDYLEKYPNLVFRLCSLPNLHNALDNNILIIQHLDESLTVGFN